MVLIKKTTMGYMKINNSFRYLNWRKLYLTKMINRYCIWSWLTSRAILGLIQWSNLRAKPSLTNKDNGDASWVNTRTKQYVRLAVVQCKHGSCYNTSCFLVLNKVLVNYQLQFRPRTTHQLLFGSLYVTRAFISREDIRIYSILTVKTRLRVKKCEC